MRLPISPSGLISVALVIVAEGFWPANASDACRAAANAIQRAMCLFTDAFGDSVADFLIDVAPVFEGALQHRFGDAVLQMTDDV